MRRQSTRATSLVDALVVQDPAVDTRSLAMMRVCQAQRMVLAVVLRHRLYWVHGAEFGVFFSKGK